MNVRKTWSSTSHQLGSSLGRKEALEARMWSLCCWKEEGTARRNIWWSGSGGESALQTHKPLLSALVSEAKTKCCPTLVLPELHVKAAAEWDTWSQSPLLQQKGKRNCRSKKHLLFAGSEVLTGRCCAQGCRTAEPSPPQGSMGTTGEAAALL